MKAVYASGVVNKNGSAYPMDDWDGASAALLTYCEERAQNSAERTVQVLVTMPW